MKAEHILGAWALVSYVKLRDGATVGHPLGEQARGLLLYTADGYMGAYLQNASNPPLVAYSGKWSIEGDVIRHDVMFNDDQARVGSRMERRASFSGETMILETPRKQTPNGVEWLQLTWRRAA